MNAKVRLKAQFNSGGFTLVELLVIIVTVAVLAAMLLPALARAKNRSTLDVCLNNQKQFAVASIMFSGDHGDYLISANTQNNTNDSLFSWRIEPANLPSYPSVPVGQSATKIYDNFGFQSGGLYPYIKNTDVIHCPTDTRYLTSGPAWCSYSVADNMNGAAPAFGTDYRLHKSSQIKNPAARMILTEENDARSQSFINGYTVYENIGTWEPYRPGTSGNGGDAPNPAVNPKFSLMKNGGQTGWWDGPAAFHATGTTFSFCDGHSEFHKWQDSNTLGFALSTDPSKSIGQYSYIGAGFNGSPNDLTWVYSHIATSVWP